MKKDRARQAAGMGLLELVMVLALLALMLGLSWPSLMRMRQRQQWQAVAEDLRSSLLFARAQATLRQQRVMLCPAANGEDCDAAGDWTLGWLVFVDADHSGRRSAEEAVLMRRQALPAQGVLQGYASVAHGVGYGAEGLSQLPSGAFQAGTLTLCVKGEPQGWRLVINAVGRPRLETVQLGACP